MKKFFLVILFFALLLPSTSLAASATGTAPTDFNISAGAQNLRHAANTALLSTGGRVQTYIWAFDGNNTLAAEITGITGFIVGYLIVYGAGAAAPDATVDIYLYDSSDVTIDYLGGTGVNQDPSGGHHSNCGLNNNGVYFYLYNRSIKITTAATGGDGKTGTIYLYVMPR